MPSEVAQRFRSELADIKSTLIGLPPDLADVPFRAGGWTRKQVVGHLLDSAANNRQRFVRAAIDGHYTGPSYAQEAWVAAHGYASQNWETLLRWWQAEHEILAAAVDRIAAERLDASCIVGDGAPVTLRFLIEDYLTHHRHHIGQIVEGTAMAQNRAQS
ncbi:MAG: DinB family protein [Terracidiphilus sp.]